MRRQTPPARGLRNASVPAFAALALALAGTAGLGGCAVAATPPAQSMKAQPSTPSPEVMRDLAPAGRLRVAINLGNVVLAQPGGPRGATGPSVDIADELGRRLGVPVDFVIYNTAGDVVDRVAQDNWAIGFLAVDPKRSEQIAFTPPYVYIEGTYMVRAGSPYHAVAALDEAGRRIAVGKGAAYDLYLSRALRHATLVRLPTSADAIVAFEQDSSLDSVAGVREALVTEAARVPGYRVLPDAFNRIEQAITVPRGRAAGLAWAAAVIEELKARGFVRAALDRAGQKGARVADPAPR